jgi:mannose/fructose-specific phosphotransferase system component IIA
MAVLPAVWQAMKQIRRTIAVYRHRFSGNLHHRAADSQLEQAVNELDAQHDIVFLTDLLAARHFAWLNAGDAKPGSEVITGTNLQLLLEMVLERDG